MELILFESYVILNTTKTSSKSIRCASRFESYVILNTTKTTKLQDKAGQ